MNLRFAASVLLFISANALANVEIIAPGEVLQDGDVRFRITGLDVGAGVDVQSDFVTQGGSVWRSVASFTADEHGVVDPAQAVPTNGSWHAADPHAFLWSMEKTKETPSSASDLENDDRSIVTVRVLQQSKLIAEKRIVMLKRAPGVSTTEIHGPVFGTFFAPYGKSSLPAVIVLGGSEGGINRATAALLASHGFASLALAYFGVDPLPPMLDRIPVETVDRAVEWLRAQPMVDGKRIAIMGGSKGAEFALVAASRNPAIRAVIAYSPSSVVFQSITYGKGGVTSSWTAGGKELPFAPYADAPAYAQSKRLVDLYDPTLAAAPPASAIAAENIAGPILLLAGKDDALWPSATMAAQITARVNAASTNAARGKALRSPTVTNLTFDHAGHHAANIPNRPTSDSVRLGGTAEGLADAQRRSWVAIVDFLDRALGVNQAAK